MYYVYSALFILAYIISWSSYFLKYKQSIISLDILAKLSYISGCLLLGGAALNGIETSIFTLCRGCIVKRVLHMTTTIRACICFSLLTIYFTILFFDFHGITTILFSIPTVLTTVTLMFGNEQHMRLILIPNAVIGICIYYALGVYSSIPCEIISCVIGLTSFTIYKKDRQSV